MKEKLLNYKVLEYFVSKNATKEFFKKLMVFAFFCLAGNLYSQTTLINPAAEGGFNLGNTFAANGWTVANEGTGPIKWVVGTAASGTTSVGSMTSGSATITLNAPNANIVQGQIVYGANIPTNTFVSSISGTTLTLSQNATASASGITLGFGMFSGGISVDAVQTTTASIAANTYTITLSAANPNISVGMEIAPIGGVIGTNTYVASINGTTLGLSKATINGTALAVAQTLNFTATTNAAISGNAAYISNDNGFTNSYAGYPATRTVYFYRDVVAPVGESAMTLTFDVKSPVTSGSGWQVWAAPVTQNVVGTNTQVTSAFTHGVSWPGATLISFNSNPQAAVTKTTAFIPKSFTGSTFRLIFVWTNNSSAGTLPPAVIDNISLTSRIPEEITCAHSGLWSQTTTWDGGKVPTHADTVVLDNENETVIIDSRYSGCEDLILVGTNTLVQYAISSTMDEFVINNDLNIAGSGARFNNHDGTTNAKYLKLGHNLDVGAGARFDSSLGSTANFQGRLTLNGSTVQTITVNPLGFMGGSTPGINGFANVAGVLNQLEVTNTSTAIPNVIWDVNMVRIKSTLNLQTGRISVTSGNRMVLGSFGSLNGVTCPPGSGFTEGTVTRWISSSNTKNVQPGTEYPGTDNNYKSFWYPFINSIGQDRSLYLLPESSPTTAGEVGVTFTNATTVTNALSITDGGYTITDRYNGNWTFTTPDGNAVPAGAAVYYTNAGTHRVGVYANGAFEALDGSSRLMNLLTAAPGVHQDGTQQPFVFRKNLTLADLIAAPFYIGLNSTSRLNTSSAIVSAASGDWNSPSTWVGSVVPTCTNVVTIASGHNVNVTSVASVAGVIISQGATLTNDGNTTEMTVGCTNNNAAFYNYGTHTMISGKLKVNGFVAYKSGSFFNQSGGEIIIDSNNNGDVATSVAFGGASCKIETSNLALTGGKITIVDPLVNEGTTISATSLGNFSLNTAGATGTYTQPTNSSANAGVFTVRVSSNGGGQNIYSPGQFVTGTNIGAGAKIVSAIPDFTGNNITITLDVAHTASVPSGTVLTFSSMSNGCNGVNLEPSASNANVAIGQVVTGPGIPPGTTVIGRAINGLDVSSAVMKIILSNAITGLTTSPITTPQTISFAAVNPGAYSTVLNLANPNIIVGMIVSGAGIAPGTFVTNYSGDTGGTAIEFSQPIQVGAPSPLILTFSPFNTLSSGSFIYSSPNHYAAGLNHTLQIGDGLSTQRGALVSNGFNCQFQAGGGLFSLGNLTVDAPNGSERFMNVSNNNSNSGFLMNVQNDFTVTSGSHFRKTFGNSTVYVGGNIVNNGTINFPLSTTTLYLGNYINGIAVPTSLPQTISGNGVFASNQWSTTNNGFSTASFASISVNNTSLEGVTLNIPLRLSTNLTLVNGIVNTTNVNLLSVGNPDVTSSTGATISGGSATAYVNGPLAFANNNSSTITQFRVLPLGKNGKYLPLAFSATGGVELMGEVFDSNLGTVNTSNASIISSDRWKLTRVGTSGDFSGYNVRLGSNTISNRNIIVHSASENGVYDVVSTPTSAITFDAAHFSMPTVPSIVLTTAQTGGFLGNFAYAEGIGCSGTPAPGATIASTTSVCSGVSVVLSLETATTGSGVTYQWQSSINGGTNWTDIPNATASTYTATPTVETSYRCNVTCSSSTVSSTPVVILVTLPDVTTTGATACSSGTLNLIATGVGIFNWYDAEVGGNLVATGTNYSPTVTSTTTYYVASATETPNVANTAAYTGTATSSAIFRGIAFDVNKQIRLKTVTVYPKNTVSLTPITIGLFDETGNMVSGTTPVTFIPTSNTGTVGTVSQVVTLNYIIPAGRGYRLVVTDGLATTNNLLGNSTASITYPSTQGSVVLLGNVTNLTGTVTTTSNTTNCFHNLTFDEICESSTRVPVTATVVDTPMINSAAATCTEAGISTISNYDSNLTYTFSPTGPSIDANGVVLNAVAGTEYTVSVVGCPSATTTFTNSPIATTNNVFFFVGLITQQGCNITLTNTADPSISYTINGTNPIGDYMFENIPFGTYNYEVKKDCFVSRNGSVTVNCLPNGEGVGVSVPRLTAQTTNNVFFFIGNLITTQGCTVTLINTVDPSITYTINGTNPIGDYMFENIPFGTYNYEVRKNCYVTKTGSVLVNCQPNGDGVGVSVGALSAVNLDTTITRVGDILTVAETGATYQWVDCDNGNTPISDQTAQSFTVTTTGNYAVIVTTPDCVRTSTCFSVATLQDQDFTFTNLKYYPNPVSNQLTIAANETITKVELFNLVGQLVKVVNTNSSEIQLDFTELPVATYLVKAYSEQNVQTFKVIKKE